jgi:hypothetical protein
MVKVKYVPSDAKQQNLPQNTNFVTWFVDELHKGAHVFINFVITEGNNTKINMSAARSTLM